MKGFISDIEAEALENTNFRKVIYTAAYMQLVLMSIPAGEEIGLETHGQDQFIRVQAGSGKAVLDGVSNDIADGSAVLIPSGTKHNIVNNGEEDLKLYTIYATPHHKDNVVHKTKADADADEEEEFLGDTTE